MKSLGAGKSERSDQCLGENIYHDVTLKSS